MAKSPTTATQDDPTKTKVLPAANGDPANDRMPAADDDVEVGEGSTAPAVARRRTDDDVGNDDDQAPRAPAPDTERDDIVARFRARRDAERDAEGNGEAGEQGSEPSAAQESKPQAQDESAGGERTDPPQTQEITLIVDGKPVKKKLEEVVQLAQITVASDNRLDEAKRLLTEARTLTGTRSEHPPKGEGEEGQTNQPAIAAASENQPETGVPQDKLRQIAERIQVGDAEEGAAAVDELVKLVNASRGNDEKVSAEQVGKLVNQQLFHIQTVQDVNGAIAQFAEDFPEIAKDKDFVRVGFEKVADELTADLKKAGLTDDDLKAFHGDPKQLAAAHRHARMNGMSGLRSYGDILDNVGNGLVKKFNLRPNPRPRSAPNTPRDPQSPSTANDRLNLKRSAAQQPRTAGARAPASQQQQRPKTSREVIEEMRVARGFARTS